MEETVIRVLRTLNKIRPFIQRDGGDVEFVKLEDGIVYVNLTADYMPQMEWGIRTRSSFKLQTKK